MAGVSGPAQHDRRARRLTLEGGFHEGLATSAYFRRALNVANPYPLSEEAKLETGRSSYGERVWSPAEALG